MTTPYPINDFRTDDPFTTVDGIRGDDIELDIYLGDPSGHYPRITGLVNITDYWLSEPTEINVEELPEYVENRRHLEWIASQDGGILIRRKLTLFTSGMNLGTTKAGIVIDNGEGGYNIGIMEINLKERSDPPFITGKQLIQ